MINIVLTRKLVLRTAAVSAVVNGLVAARFILMLDKRLEQGTYLAAIVARNPEILEEFDKIALRDLGILGRSK